MIDNPLFENNIIEDSCSLVEEARVRDIDVLLEDLPLLRGASFISQLKEITVHPSFYLVKNESNIFSTGGESSEDYDNLLNPNRSLGPISSGDVKVFSCSPESKECLPLIYGSHKT